MRNGRARKICIAVCGAVILALAFYLIAGPKPWKEGVAAVEAAGGSGNDIKTLHHIVSGEWYGSLANLILAIGLLIGSRWLIRPLSDDFAEGKAAIPPKSRLFFVLATLLAVMLGAFLNAPRLDSSLWGDEEQTMKRTIVGDYLRTEDGKGDGIRFRPAPWSDTFFRYRTPNNHILNSVLARASHELLFRPSDAPQALHFSETIIRLPSFLAGLAGIAATGWCLAVMGFPRAGVAAMFLLVIHPWFIRYGVDTRGYAYLFPLIPLAVGFLVKAVRLGLWRHFFLFGLCEVLMFYAYPGTLYVLLALNLAAVLILPFGTGLTVPDKVTLFTRWLVANVAAAMLVIQLMAPTLKPLGEYLARERAKGVIDSAWVADNLSYLATGISWLPWETGNPRCEYLSSYGPTASSLMLGAVGLCVLLGIWRMIGASRQTLFLCAVFTLPWPLLVIHSHLGGRLLYHWYSIICLPGIIMLVALGLEYMASKARRIGTRNLGGIALLLLFGFAFLSFTSAQRGHLRNGSVEQMRESVAATRSVLNPGHPDIGNELTVGFCMATRGYDPYAYFFKKDDEAGFRQLIERARKQGKPLHVNFALRGLAEVFYPKMMAIIEDPSVFEPLPPFYGLEAPCTRFVYRLK